MRDPNHLSSVLLARARPAAVFARLPDGRTLTYADLIALADRISAKLLSVGLAPGDRVAVQVDKSIEALALYLGVLRAGGAFLPLNPAYTDAEVEGFLNDAEPSVFVTRPQRVTAQAPLATAAGARAVYDLAADGSGALLDDAPTIEGFVPVARAADDLAAILYTSGTTGRSKGAMTSHANLATNAASLARIWRFSADDRLIHALPIFHTHGLFVATNVALISGASLDFFPRFDADAVIAAMPHATAMMGVPTFYTRLLQHPELGRAARHMRVFISGSAPLLSETHDAFADATGHAILERYGMTETGMITSNPYDGPRRAGTVGLPLPDVEVRVVDQVSEEDLGPSEIGSVLVRGPNVFSGYWRMPDKTAQEFRPGGWFVTGDLGVKDAAGILSLVGRSKDLIITGGFNVYPKEIETVLDAVEGVLESAVIGVPHPDFGEGVVAIVVRSGGHAVSEAQIADAIAPQLARYKQPKRVMFVDALPRNAMGKVTKADLRKEFAALF